MTSTDDDHDESGGATPRSWSADADDQRNLEAVARGGALNLVGAVVYGATQFLLLAVVANGLGAERAGEFITAIVVFNILAKVCELGGATGLVRTVSHRRATGDVHELHAIAMVAVGGALAAGVVACGTLWVVAPGLAQLFATGGDVDRIASLLRSLAPFLPFAAAYSVVIQGTRGFDTMVPQVVIEKIAKSSAQVAAVLGVVVFGGDVRAALLVWAGVQLLALVPAVVVGRRLMQLAESAGVGQRRRIDLGITRSFLAFSLPRSLGQVFQVTILWFDTLLIAAILGTTEAGIYGTGTRYLLVGLFASEAIMQVLGPRISGLLARADRREASRLLTTAAAWQTAVVWPVYLLVMTFPGALLGVFGEEFLAARSALLFLSIAMLLASPFGPSDTVVLMSGRSRQSLFNTLVAVVVNVGGNLLFVPLYGIPAAAAVWGTTIVIAAVLPAWQSRRTLGVSPFGRGPLIAAVAATAAYLPLALVARVGFGDRLAALGVAAAAATGAYVCILRRFGADVQLEVLFRAIVRRPTRTVDGSWRRAGSSADQTS